MQQLPLAQGSCDLVSKWHSCAPLTPSLLSRPHITLAVRSEGRFSGPDARGGLRARQPRLWIHEDLRFGGIGVEDILYLNPFCDSYGVESFIAATPIVDYSLDIVEVDVQRQANRGKMSGRKRFVELPDSPRTVIAASLLPK